MAIPSKKRSMLRILVVEDSSSTRALVRAILEDGELEKATGADGVEVTEAESGFDAMRFLPRGHFDLVVTDINMPDINGLELIQFIRKSPHSKDTPVLVISTQAAERDIARGLSLGANAFVAKPFSREGLRDACAALVSKRHGDGSARPASPRVRHPKGEPVAMADRDVDKAKDEFFSEAQEIVDGLSRDLARAR